VAFSGLCQPRKNRILPVVELSYSRASIIALTEDGEKAAPFEFVWPAWNSSVAIWR